MNRARAGVYTLILGCVGVCLGAAPVTPSYQAVAAASARAHGAVAPAGGTAPATAPGWTRFLDALDGYLKAYAGAATEADRRAALERLNQMTAALGSVAWPPAAELRMALWNWLQPRLSLAEIASGLEQGVKQLPATTDPGLRDNRQRWIEFVENKLGAALRAYETAPDVAARRAACDQIDQALETLRQVNQQARWTPSYQLSAALAALFEQPNVEATADLPTVTPYLSHDVAITGYIARRGQVAQVTAGQKTGFALVPSDNGIAFYNSQLLTAYTPIRGFNEQVASDPQGQQAAQMYYFCASTLDYSEMRVTSVLRPTGLDLYFDPAHNVQFLVNAVPTAGHNLMRGVAALIGMNRERIIQRVQSEGYPRVAQEVADGRPRGSRRARRPGTRQENAKLAKYLIGHNSLAVGPVILQGLDLRSRPEFALVRGTLEWRGGPSQLGADTPKPPQFARVAPGITADLHLPSLLTNMSRGAFQTEKVQSVTNVMLVIRPAPAGTAPQDAVKTTNNVDYATFLKTIDTFQADKDTKTMALRVRRPKQAPDFAVDRNGRLVALVHDFVAEVPAPPGQNALGGPPARVYRLEAPLAQFAISLHYEPPPRPPSRASWARSRNSIPAPTRASSGSASRKRKRTR